MRSAFWTCFVESVNNVTLPGARWPNHYPDVECCPATGCTWMNSYSIEPVGFIRSTVKGREDVLEKKTGQAQILTFDIHQQVSS